MIRNFIFFPFSFGLLSPAVAVLDAEADFVGGGTLGKALRVYQ
jgi:hypothetical protein